MIDWPDNRKPYNAHQLVHELANLMPQMKSEIGLVNDTRIRTLLTDLLELIDLCAVAAREADNRASAATFR